MSDILRPDICVIGAGSAGLSVASGAALMGARVVLVEKGRMGGDCLNYGCVPSKALLAAAHMADTVRRAPAFGVQAGTPAIDFLQVMAHVRGVVAAIAPADSAARYRALGVHLIEAAATFVGPDSVMAGGVEIRPRRFVIATGSEALVPPIPGLAQVPYFTNETLFANTQRPEHLLILGGGPIGIEMAQAHARLGCRVTVLQSRRVLPRDDPELVDQLLVALRRDGVTLRAPARVTAVGQKQGGIVLTLESGETVTGSHLLVAAGRRLCSEGLGLDAAGIAYSARGIAVDAGLRTTNRRAFAIGDAAGLFQFTHVAGHHAGVVLRRILFRLPARAEQRAIPWVTYTDPELAHVGLTEAEARRHAGAIGVLRWPVAENDRARAERRSDGLIKVVVDRRGRVVGASILAPDAGNLIGPWAAAVSQRSKPAGLARAILPYPTLAELSKRVAGSYYLPALSSARTRRLVRFLARFG